jgi:vacuolar-type H+-ATPase subunit H
MKTITLGLLVMLLGESGTTTATEVSIDSATKQLLKDTAKPLLLRAARKRVHVAAESIEKAKNLRESIDKASAALEEQILDSAEESAERQLKEVVPGQAKAIKSQVKNVPKSARNTAKAVKKKAKQEVAEKVLESMR